jgi:hypothetical protein
VRKKENIYLNSEGKWNENQITKHQHETQSFSNNVPPGKGNEGNQGKDDKVWSYTVLSGDEIFVFRHTVLIIYLPIIACHTYFEVINSSWTK